MPDAPKPPIGLMPRKLWLERRLADVFAAIDRYMAAGVRVQPEWCDERDQLTLELERDG
jgi:hypothetical protein